MLPQAERAQIAADHFEQRGRHELLQKPEKFFLVSRLLDREEARKIDAFMLKCERRKRNIAIDPHNPAALRDDLRCGFEPERSRARTKGAAEKRESALRQTTPEEKAVEGLEPRRAAFRFLQPVGLL
jgi:hypothetical protein